MLGPGRHEALVFEGRGEAAAPDGTLSPLTVCSLLLGVRGLGGGWG